MTEPHDWNVCQVHNCEECQALVNEGIIMSCDGCYEPGHADAAGGWSRDKDGLVYCDSCVRELGIEPT